MPGPDLRRTIEELARDVAGLDYAVAQETLRSVYRLAWLTLLEDIERTLRSGGKPPQQVARLLNSVTRTLRAVDRTAAQWTSQYLPRAYRAGLQQGVMQLAQQNVRVEPPDSSGMLHRGALQSIARDTMQDLLQATKRVEERVKDRVRDVMREDVLARVASGRRASGKEVAKRLAEEDGVFGVTDKRGRFIPMEEYARMVSHVKLRQAHTEGMEGLMQDHGFDLVQISEHVHKPDLCTPLEGKVYSLTGKTPGWPKLPRHTPFHIGCRHVETPFVDTFLSDEQLEALKAKSGSGAPINVYTPAQLEAADAKRAQRERGRKARKERQKRNAAAVATRRKKPKAALAEELQEARGSFTGGRLPTAEEQAERGAAGRKWTGEDPHGGFDALNAPAAERAGKRYIGVTGLEQPIGKDHPDKVLELYKDAIEKGPLKGFDRMDAEILLRYIEPEGTNKYVYDEILNGGPRGLALLIHESVEVRSYFADGKFNPWKRGDQEAGYPARHGNATVAEAQVMFVIAKRRGVPVDSFWDMIRGDGNATPRGTEEPHWEQQVEENERFARQFLALDPEEVPKSREHVVAEVRKFWDTVDAGTVQITDDDYAAIQALGDLGRWPMGGDRRGLRG